MTAPRQTLELLADWLELDRAVTTAEATTGRVPGPLLIQRMHALEALQPLDPAALRAEAHANRVIEEAAQARYADRLRVDRLDRLIGEREWHEALTDPAVRAEALDNTTNDRIQAAQDAIEALISARVAALVQAGGSP
ncbi:hypothetical protein [Deinococcus soli (ex Cha et al. 2016)]|uniref:Uncharacterized protein n=2 Tax=Deinococcus soli (ex Cha et al. 2016) TaxID=1309411 RepID=A0AAE4BLA6_9DEIO|nr:hypothetical protein [Deinococcus soli (ex Cha et al. 2016)]MDR6218748.1 hypothetical protein [Deinococcus soli (ex Cha et al. 2016)]MDR6328545.1 hypothetical protein [Deinococcus soli (ex Cha et al. 2016)]MDR6753156.1 hypothetical protein [Deinococcus soli (ex Cha et al. 2016)]